MTVAKAGRRRYTPRKRRGYTSAAVPAPTRSGKNRRVWTDDEIAAVVDAYCHLLDTGEHRMRAINYVLRLLRVERLAERREEQIERRFANISRVLEQVGRDYVRQFEPKKYVPRALRARFEAVYLQPLSEPARRRRAAETARRGRFAALVAEAKQRLHKRQLRRRRQQMQRAREKARRAAARAEREARLRAVAEQRRREQEEAERRRQGQDEHNRPEPTASPEPSPSNPKTGEERRRMRATADRAELDALVAALLAEGLIARPVGNATPSQKVRGQAVIKRLASVVVYTLQAANGRCELCGKKAPFKAKDGHPYLEVHHVKPLAEGGPDTPENAAALCPNCHRKIHLGIDADRSRAHLTSALERRERARCRQASDEAEAGTSVVSG